MKSSYISLLRMSVVLGGNMKKRVVPSLLVFFYCLWSPGLLTGFKPRSRIIRAKPSKSSWGLRRADFTTVGRAYLVDTCRSISRAVPKSWSKICRAGALWLRQIMSIAWLNRMD